MDNYQLAREEVEAITAFDPNTLEDIAAYWRVPLHKVVAYWREAQTRKAFDKAYKKAYGYQA